MKQSALSLNVLAITVNSLLVTGIAWWFWQSNQFGIALNDDVSLSWHLVRATGITAYGLLTLSMMWGIALSSRIVKSWSPGPVSMLLHGTVSWLALALSGIHAILLLFDKYYTYQISDIVVPFVGPYKPLAVGLGTSAFWLSLAIALSFSVKKWIGRKAWRWLHLTSYFSYLLVTAHVLMAGTDAGNTGFWLLAMLSGAMVVAMLIYHQTRQYFTGKKK